MGKFVCIYGINNLGKTTQSKLLVARLRERGYKAEYLKYPIYQLDPTGTIIYRVLRDPTVHLDDPTAKQLLYTANRFQFAPELEKLLSENDIIVAEDYVGTGLAWGMAEGADPDYIVQISAPLRHPDLEILLDGERFSDAVEEGHKHETNEELIARCRECHLQLAERYGWPTVSADRSIDEVRENIWKEVEKVLDKK